MQTRYLQGPKGMKGHTFPRATVLTPFECTNNQSLLSLHEATEQTQRNDSKKEVTECDVFGLRVMFFGILDHLIIFTPCSKHGDSLSVCSVTIVPFYHCFFLIFWTEEASDASYPMITQLCLTDLHVFYLRSA